MEFEGSCPQDTLGLVLLKGLSQIISAMNDD
jgi:hypothetical protein